METREKTTVGGRFGRFGFPAVAAVGLLGG